MSWVATLRVLAYAKRMTLALESISESLTKLAQFAQDEWEEKHAPKKGKLGEFSSFDPNEASNRWEMEQKIKRGEA